MTDAEKLIMKGSAQAQSLEPDRIAGVSTRETLTPAAAAYAIAGMGNEEMEGLSGQRVKRYSELQIQQAEAALYHAIGIEHAHRKLYQLLMQMIDRGQRTGRLPRQLCVAQYPHLISTLAVIASSVPPLDQVLAGGDAEAWHRELAPVYREARGAISHWTALGLAHVRRRTADEEDGE